MIEGSTLRPELSGRRSAADKKHSGAADRIRVSSDGQAGRQPVTAHQRPIGVPGPKRRVSSSFSTQRSWLSCHSSSGRHRLHKDRRHQPPRRARPLRTARRRSRRARNRARKSSWFSMREAGRQDVEAEPCLAEIELAMITPMIASIIATFMPMKIAGSAK